MCMVVGWFIKEFKKYAISLYFILLIVIWFLISCKPENSFNTSPDANVATSLDSLKFDTVFVSRGSIIKSFLIYNNNEQKLRINKIRLGGGNNSFFKMNVNGLPTTSISDIEILKNDSIYVFIQVNIDPNNALLPYLVRDSVLIDYNGVQKKVSLEAYGKNAIFLNNQVIKTNTTWSNQLPYVILGGLLVDSFAQLTIPAGTSVFCNANAPIIVKGRLHVLGNTADTAQRVVFAGDRLDEGYKDLPASWPGIVFTEISTNNTITGVIIKNAFQAIVVDKPLNNTITTLTLRNTVIENAYENGIVVKNAQLSAYNCLLSNCGNAISIAEGGNYIFEHCTMASYSTKYILHKNALAIISNTNNVNNATPYVLQMQCKNCIFWADVNGIVDDELKVQRQGNTPFAINLNNCLYRATNALPNITFSQAILNTNPLFDSINIANNYYSFKLKPTSPVLQKGLPSTLVVDLDNKNRTVGAAPDMGCYEVQ
jgi:hypothetical protein